MFLFKVAPVLLFVLVAAEKKIELQDIEDDNLKSENQKDSDDQPEARSQTDGTEPGASLEFLKNGFLRYFEAPSQSQSARYVQQYSVSEAPERASATPRPHYAPPPTAQQAMVGYLSNVPMQIYLVPQYYSESPEQGSPHGAPYQTVARVAGYQGPPEAVQPHTNYVEVPAYVAPTGKTFIQQYTQPITYVSYAHPTIAPVQATVAPVLTYQMPVVQYPTAIVAPQTPKAYYQNSQYTETNEVEEVHDNEIDNPRHYSAQTEVPYIKSPPEFPRYYNSRTPLREEYRSAPSELPHPSPLLLKPPPHLNHLAKTLPIYRPLAKPVYGTANIIPAPLTPRPIEGYGPKRRPTSLIDSYIPSSVQVEYLKRGFAKDPLVLYETLSNNRHFPPPVIPRHYERGFLPNQMFHTAAGGVTFGHHKRSSKGDKVPQK